MVCNIQEMMCIRYEYVASMNMWQMWASAADATHSHLTTLKHNYEIIQIKHKKITTFNYLASAANICIRCRCHIQGGENP